MALVNIVVARFAIYSLAGYLTSPENNFLYTNFDSYRRLKMSKKQIYYSDKYNDEEFEYRYDYWQLTYFQVSHHQTTVR